VSGVRISATRAGTPGRAPGPKPADPAPGAFFAALAGVTPEVLRPAPDPGPAAAGDQAPTGAGPARSAPAPAAENHPALGATVPAASAADAADAGEIESPTAPPSARARTNPTDTGAPDDVATLGAPVRAEASRHALPGGATAVSERGVTPDPGAASMPTHGAIVMAAEHGAMRGEAELLQIRTRFGPARAAGPERGSTDAPEASSSPDSVRVRPRPVDASAATDRRDPGRDESGRGDPPPAPGHATLPGAFAGGSHAAPIVGAPAGAEPPAAPATTDPATRAARPPAPAEPWTTPSNGDRLTLRFDREDGVSGRVRVVLRGGTVHAAIVADDADSASRLERGIGELRSALGAGGFEAPRVRVQVAGDGASARRDGTRDERDPGPHSHTTDDFSRRDSRDPQNRRRAPDPSARRDPSTPSER